MINMEKNLEYYLTEARKRVTSIEEEAETDFSDEINEEQDAKEDKIEKIETFIYNLGNDPSPSEINSTAEKIYKLFEK